MNRRQRQRRHERRQAHQERTRNGKTLVRCRFDRGPWELIPMSEFRKRSSEFEGLVTVDTVRKLTAAPVAASVPVKPRKRSLSKRAVRDMGRQIRSKPWWRA